MARRNLVREKKNHTWRFFTVIASSIMLAIIGVIVLLVCLYNNAYTEEYRNRFDDLTVYKINLEDLMEELKDSEKSHQAFIMVYDESYYDQEAINELDPDDDEDAELLKQKADWEFANKNIDKFVKEIKKNHKAFDEESDPIDYVRLYVVNASLIGNESIFSTDMLNNGKGDNQEVVELDVFENGPALYYWHGETARSYSPTDDDKKIIRNGGTYLNFGKALGNATEYLRDINEKSAN